ncbi:MAG: PAS domain S-box protein, partial [Phycisphaerales bacterium]|nr:PAS domain S-box protein [Phycisphaerales bacterium]
MECSRSTPARVFSRVSPAHSSRSTALDYCPHCSNAIVHWRTARIRQHGAKHDGAQTRRAKIREQAALIDIATDAIFVRDLENRIRFWNQGAERMYGWTQAETLGATTNKLFPK